MNQWTDRPLPTDDELDALLRRAVQARPEPEVGQDLARRAIAAARAEAAAPPLARRGEWVAWVLATAGLLAVVTFGYWRLTALEAARAAYDSASPASGAASADAIGTLLLVGLGALAASVVYLAAQASLSPDDEPLRPGLG